MIWQAGLATARWRVKATVWRATFAVRECGLPVVRLRGLGANDHVVQYVRIGVVIRIGAALPYDVRRNPARAPENGDGRGLRARRERDARVTRLAVRRVRRDNIRVDVEDDYVGHRGADASGGGSCEKRRKFPVIVYSFVHMLSVLSQLC